MIMVRSVIFCIEAIGIGYLQNFTYVVMATYFENELDAGFARVKGDALTHVLHLDDVCVVTGAHVEDAGKRAGAVG